LLSFFAYFEFDGTFLQELWSEKNEFFTDESLEYCELPHVGSCIGVVILVLGVKNTFVLIFAAVFFFDSFESFIFYVFIFWVENSLLSLFVIFETSFRSCFLVTDKTPSFCFVSTILVVAAYLYSLLWSSAWK